MNCTISFQGNETAIVSKVKDSQLALLDAEWRGQAEHRESPGWKGEEVHMI